MFTWHFIHVNNGHLAQPPVFPLSLLTEGHTGVALFMVLSGYLFAKLLDGKKIVYTAFIWNRFLRLAPLLLAVILFIGFERYLAEEDLFGYVKSVFSGIVKPCLPNGGWSITAEFHFYLMLPILLFIKKKWKYSLLFVLLAAVITRTVLHQVFGQIQTLSYWTIAGRIDQFVLGILFYRFGRHLSGKHGLVLCGLTAFAVFYWYFDSQGGFYMSPSYPSPGPVWIFMPTIEGLVYAMAIAWYDNSFEHSAGRVSRFVALVGTCSYSIYLLHYFFVFDISKAIHSHVVDLSNIHLAILFSVLCFGLMVPIGYLSYNYIESPFLKFRKRYVVGKESG